MAKHERQAGSADALLMRLNHQDSDALHAFLAGAALPEPAAAPCEVVALLTRQPPRAAGHGGARPVAAGQLHLSRAKNTVISERCMMGPFWASCHLTALGMCISV